MVKFKTYCFDLDETLCHTVDGDYVESVPYYERIKLVNKLYDTGHRILIDTARGSESGLDWFKLTENQLEEWGVKYHRLRVGTKFAADHYIDDKGITDTTFFPKGSKDHQMRLDIEI